MALDRGLLHATAGYPTGMSKMPKSPVSPAKARKAVSKARPRIDVKQLAADPKLRKSMATSAGSALSAYSRLRHAKSAQKAVDDKRLRGDIKQAVVAIGSARSRLQKVQRKQHNSLRSKMLLALPVVGMAAALLNSSIRNRVLGRSPGPGQGVPDPGAGPPQQP
jgi:hypothetical protein